MVMTPSSPATPDSPTTNNSSSSSENNLQPFYLLPKSKTRRKIDISEPPKSNDNNHHHRLQALDLMWSSIDTTIKQVLKHTNTNVFDQIHVWLRQSLAPISGSATNSCSKLIHPYPLPTATAAACKIFTGLVFTKNIDIVDDLLTFKQLNLHLKSNGCHVVNLSSLDFTHGIAGCVTTLIRQFVTVVPDVPDIAILASWYGQPDNYGKPLVVIIDDMERCNGAVLSDFILLLSEWVVKIPVILVMGVATTPKPKLMLPANALQHLHPCQFALGSPPQKLNAILEAIFLNNSCGFHIGYKVALFLKYYFSKQDGTVTSFVRALKIACTKHFVLEPLSFLCKDLLEEDDHASLIGTCELLPQSMRDYAFNLPSCGSMDKTVPVTGHALASGLCQLMVLWKQWRSAFLCLYEASKFQNVQLLDLLCESLDSASYDSNLSGNHQLGKYLSKISSIGYASANKGSLIKQVIRKVKDLPVKPLHRLLRTWRKQFKEIPEVHEKVTQLLSMLKSVDESNAGLQPDITSVSKKHGSRSHMSTERDRGKVSDKAGLLMEHIVRDYLKPIECAPFHEIICFKNVDTLQSAVIGDPRRMVQVDLLKSHEHLQCSCCSNGGNLLLPSMHDTSILYTMAQEHGDLINLHDWFQSFKSTILQPRGKAKRKMHSPSPKKRKQTTESENMNSPLSKRTKQANESGVSDALIQARFCRAVTELQITGLLRMPSKRRPDFVQRVAFGL